jgi:hypothetical protein
MKASFPQRLAVGGAMLLAAASALAAEDLLDESAQQEYFTPEQKADPKARGALGVIRFDNWGYLQKNVNGSHQWQYRPRIFVPWVFGNGWIASLRTDVPMNFTNNRGPAHTGGGYSGGIGNPFFEAILDTAEVAPSLTLRTSLRLVLKSPKGPPFGVDNQYQIAPGVGLTYRMPQTLNGITFSPFVRWVRGFNGEFQGVQLVSTLQVIPATTFRIDDRWSFALYPENPILYNHNTSKWFVPLDFLVIHRLNPSLEFALGGASKIGSPSAPAYDYVINGRVTLFF